LTSFCCHSRNEKQRSLNISKSKDNLFCYSDQQNFITLKEDGEKFPAVKNKLNTCNVKNISPPTSPKIQGVSQELGLGVEPENLVTRKVVPYISMAIIY
jgi:hypothetical protein